MSTRPATPQQHPLATKGLRRLTDDTPSLGHRITALALVAVLGIAALLVAFGPPSGLFARVDEDGPGSGGANGATTAATRAPEAPPAAAVAAETPAAETAAQRAELQRAADHEVASEARHRALRLLARLQAGRVELWGAEDYARAVNELDAAEALLGDDRPAEANAAYNAATATLERLEASRPERLQRTLQTGDEELAQLDSPAAMAAFDVALAIEPNNAHALAGHARAEQLPRALGLLAAGEQFERDGKLERAKASYTDALGVDGQLEPARQRLDAVELRLLERAFQLAMSAALNALRENDVAGARRAIDTIERLRPEANTSDLKAQLVNLERRLRLQELGQRVARHAAAEEWNRALSASREALQIDATAAFALAGAARANRAIELNGLVQEYLDKPAELSDVVHERHARNIHATVGAQCESMPKLQAKVDRLGQLIEKYTTKVTVLFESDGETEVRLLRCGRLGKFEARRASLRPGQYRAKGIRSGYRDVIVTFEVRCAEEPTDLVVVVCKEKV